MAQELLSNKNLVHGKIRIGFTPDEEVGCGVDFFDVEALAQTMPIPWTAAI